MRGHGKRRIYSEEALNEIRARANIVEVISDYTSLKQAGNSYKGLCPFHNEKTPSFTVSTEKQLFYCFGCGAGGDIFNFVMKIEKIKFRDAVKMLAERVGVTLPESESPEAREARKKLGRLYDCMEAACRYYETVFAKNPNAAEARNYISQRGLSDDAVRCFRLGYALKSWDGILKTLIESGFSTEELLSAGLILPSKSGKGYYDRFRGRLMFPITDVAGRVIGFGGRVLDNSEPKYLNSPETALFQKGKIIYGLALARNAIRNKSRAVIVEGYTDTITCHQFGFENVVATLGTALTKSQAKAISRYTSQVIMAYDADTAGNAATLRGMEVLKNEGADVKIGVLPIGEDPDSVLRKQGKEAFTKILEDAKQLIDYKLHLIISQVDTSDLDQKVKAAKEVAQILAGVGSAVERGEYAEKTARLLKISVEAMLEDINSLISVQGSRKAGSRRFQVRDRFGVSRNTSFKDDIAKSCGSGTAQVLKAERLLLRIMIDNKEIFETVEKKLKWDEFSDKRHKKLARAIQTGLDVFSEDTGKNSLTPAEVISFIDDRETLEYAAGVFIGEGEELPENLKKAADDCINVILEHNLVGRIREIEKELMSLSGTGKMQKSRELLAEFGYLKKRISEEFRPFRGIL